MPISSSARRASLDPIGTSRSLKCIIARRPTRRPGQLFFSAIVRRAVAAPSFAPSAVRDGTGLIRERGAIGFAALRGGSVAGDHEVMFLGPEERLILSHRAEDRSIFARGALAGARFLVGKAAGLYSMRDVIDAL